MHLLAHTVTQSETPVPPVMLAQRTNKEVNGGSNGRATLKGSHAKWVLQLTSDRGQQLTLHCDIENRLKDSTTTIQKNDKSRHPSPLENSISNVMRKCRPVKWMFDETTGYRYVEIWREVATIPGT